MKFEYQNYGRWIANSDNKTVQVEIIRQSVGYHVYVWLNRTQEFECYYTKLCSAKRGAVRAVKDIRRKVIAAMWEVWRFETGVKDELEV